MNLFTKKFKKVVEEDITGGAFFNALANNNNIGSQGDVYAAGNTQIPKGKKTQKQSKKKLKKVPGENAISVPFKRTFPELLSGLTGQGGKMGYNSM